MKPLMVSGIVCCISSTIPSMCHFLSLEIIYVEMWSVASVKDFFIDHGRYIHITDNNRVRCFASAHWKLREYSAIKIKNPEANYNDEQC